MPQFFFYFLNKNKGKLRFIILQNILKAVISQVKFYLNHARFSFHFSIFVLISNMKVNMSIPRSYKATSIHSSNREIGRYQALS